MKKLLWLGISGFILGLGLIAPPAEAQTMTSAEAQAALAQAERQLAELQAQVALQQVVVATDEKTELRAALGKLEMVLREVDTRIAEGSLPSDQKTAVNMELGDIRTTLATIDGTIRSTAVAQAPQLPRPVAQARPAPIEISVAPLPAAEVSPGSPDVSVNEDPSPAARTTANIGSAAQGFVQGWQFWAILLLAAVAAVSGVLMNRRRDPLVNSAATPTPDPAGPPTSPPQS